MSNYQGYTSLNHILVPRSLTSSDERYSRTGCLSEITNLLNNNTDFISLNPGYFFNDTTPERPILTLSGCQAMCGTKWGPYPDDGPRVLEWIIPGILLLANMHFAPIGRKRYLMIAHILGDPIDSMWRLLSIAEDWVESSQLARDIMLRHGQQFAKLGYTIQPEMISVIISATARLVESFDMKTFCTELSENLDNQTILEEKLNKLKKTAIALREQRLHDIRRTGFAILLYIFQVITVFVPIVGGSPSVSGGRVSPAMMLVWLLPIVLLSNAIGDYGCWKHSEKTLFEFFYCVGIDPNNTKKRSPYISELACTGSVVHSRPWGVRQAILRLISVLPVAIACATAFAVDYTGPTYFSCRATLIISSFVVWLLSSTVTELMRTFLRRRRHLWLFIMIKDILVATPILVLIMLSACGYFNSCYCASGVIARGVHAFVDLNPSSFYPLNNHVIYPAAVTLGIVFQMLIPLFVRCLQLKGFQIMWYKFPEKAHRLELQEPGEPSGLAGKQDSRIEVTEVRLEESEGLLYQ